MEPTPKSEDVNKVLDAYGRSISIKADKCVPPPIGCGMPVTHLSFRDSLSRKEYAISGLCQTCQDKIFGNPNNEEEY